MICPNCNRLRHDGPCEPVFDDSAYELEGLKMDIEMAKGRYEAALKRAAENHKDAAE